MLSSSSLFVLPQNWFRVLFLVGPRVLRDGASAQYGSDAIGGVVNIVLKSGERRDLPTSFGSVYSSEGGRDFRDGRPFDASTTLQRAPARFELPRERLC